MKTKTSNRWLVTGGAGFIGSHLVDLLIERNDQVVVLDDLSGGSLSNLPDSALLTVHTGDVGCPNRLAQAMAGVTGIFHCAALVGVQDCIRDWTGGHARNLTATIRLFETARKAGNVPVVYASSAAVYGDRSDDVCHEELQERPLSPYGADKLACEHQASAFWQIHQLPTAGLRFFNVYGPRQSATSAYSGVTALFSANEWAGRKSVIIGDGRQSRDFIFVSDVVRGMAAAMDRLHSDPACLVSNLCTGRSITVLELLGIIQSETDGKSLPPEFKPGRAGEIRHSRGSTKRMRENLGITDLVPIEKGIAEYLRWELSEQKTVERLSALG
ncbi:MAG: NAD-dependent epimerase/dehydratase family protein [Pseudomonadota bacterium]